MVTVSPGVYTRERDVSLYVPQLSTSIVGMVGTASKGPVNTVTLFADEASFVEAHGAPSASHLAMYAAIRYLRKGKMLKFVRVASYDASASGIVQNAAADATALTFTAVSSGSWGNDISILVSSGRDAGTYKLTVLSADLAVEVYDLIKVGAANVASPNYITTRINGISSYVSVVADTAQSDLLVSATAEVLTGGDDGATVSDSDVIGSLGTPPTVPTSGLQLFRDANTQDINVLCVPGNSNRAVIAEMIDICTTRADAICLIDIPYGKTVTQAVAWSNGLGGGPNDPTAAINSNYAAVYGPWVKVYDGYTNAEVWIPPTGHVCGAIAYTDYVADPWFAPAGPARGVLSDVLDLEYNASQGDCDYMYGNGNIINPIIKHYQRGYVIWGQRTATRTSSKLDRINVRRLLLFLRKGIATAAIDVVMQPNDEVTWAEFRSMVEPILADAKARRGLEDYSVVCDETTNTLAVRNRKEFKANIMVVPVDTGEMVEITFSVLNNVTQFSEF